MLEPSRANALLDIARENPDTTLKAARYLRLPAHHEVRAENIDLKRLGAVLAVAYERICASSPNFCSWRSSVQRTLHRSP